MYPLTLFADMLKFNAGYLARTLDGLEIEKYLVRPEGRGNHLMWILGHIVLNRGEMIELLGGDPKTRDLGDRFARDTHPESNPALYPQPQVLITRYLKLAALTDHLIKQCDQSLMERPGWGQFETLGQHLAFSYMHETHHIGQMLYIVNLPSVRSARRSSSFARPEPKKNSTTKIVLDSIKSVFSQ